MEDSFVRVHELFQIYFCVKSFRIFDLYENSRSKNIGLSIIFRHMFDSFVAIETWLNEGGLFLMAVRKL